MLQIILQNKEILELSRSRTPVEISIEKPEVKLLHYRTSATDETSGSEEASESESEWSEIELVSQTEKELSDSAAQIPLCGNPVPACCHGNAVRDLNTSLCPLPTSLLSPSFHSTRLSPRFL